MLEAITAMASVIGDPYLLMLIAVTTVLGIVIGVLPGLGATTGAALLLPFTLTMSPVNAIAVLATLYVSATFAGSITAILINTARGGIGNENDLANALRQGDISGAGIDVLTQEPPGADHPLLAPDIPNLLVSPHNAWGSVQSRQRLADEIADLIQAYRQQTPRNCCLPD